MTIFHANDPEIRELFLHLKYLFNLPDGVTAIELRLEVDEPVQLIVEMCPQRSDE